MSSAPASTTARGRDRCQRAGDRQEVPLTFYEAQYQLFLSATFPIRRCARRWRTCTRPRTSARRGWLRRAHVRREVHLPSRTIAARSWPASRKRSIAISSRSAGRADLAAVWVIPRAGTAYLFGKLDVRGYVPTAAERALSTALQQYWGTFARTACRARPARPRGAATTGPRQSSAAERWRRCHGRRRHHAALRLLAGTRLLALAPGGKQRGLALG